MAGDSKLAQRVGARIKARRIDRGLSQNALARRIPDTPVSAGYISRWERGENMPSWANLEAVADALGVSVAWLFAEADDDEPALAA